MTVAERVAFANRDLVAFASALQDVIGLDGSVTVARWASPVPVGRIEDAASALRQRGLRFSAARRLLVEALLAAERPVRAEEIASGLDGRLPSSDLASVYRNLEKLEKVGIVRHVHLGHGAGRYGLAAAADCEYLVCERCGSTRAVPPAELDELRQLIRARFGFEARFSHIPLAGVCRDCAAGQSP